MARVISGRPAVTVLSKPAPVVEDNPPPPPPIPSIETEGELFPSEEATSVEEVSISRKAARKIRARLKKG